MELFALLGLLGFTRSFLALQGVQGFKAVVGFRGF